MVLPLNFWILFGICMLVSAIGFKNYVWFISLGYGFSIAAQGLAMLFMFGHTLTLGTIICCVVFFLYGCRLGGYLAYREFKMTSYNKNMKGEIKDGKTVPFGVKIAIWTSCALLYVTQIGGVFYRLQNAVQDNAFVFIGAVIMVAGVSLESAADIQKNNAKKINPRRWVDTGLYRLVRCPNYLGEMIFWTGVLISGIGAVHGWQWLVVAIGYIGIIFVMFSGARRLEVRQNKNYGADPEYQKYVKTVPILLPFIPLYSVEKHKWLVA
jgi:steroid 5-alpha reductase family enzyme